MEITWEVEDGYVGKSRPQHTEVDDDELADCETSEQRRELIDNCVQDDFERNISFSVNSYD